MVDKQIELLAPAGGMDALTAAVESGADAIYLGGKEYSARKYASNFDLNEIEDACRYAHIRGVKIYVTVNTLIDNSELRGLVKYVCQLYNAGVDGIIVQDIGVMHLIHNYLPEIEVHISTQMAIHNSLGAKLLHNMGIKRVVLARELSLESIKAIHNKVAIELECFAHGALCVSYSGQCLMSSLIGGRSGNRGSCAQPCRLKYKLVDKGGRVVSNEAIGEHLLSPKDLYTIDIIPQLIEAGVTSLKFEGRMKKPEYVATVIRNYRQALDRYFDDKSKFVVLPSEEEELRQIFNRDFTSAYLTKHPGADLMSFKRPNNRGLMLGRIAKFDFNNNRATIKLDSRLSLGDGIEVWVTQGGRVGTTVEKIFVNGKAVKTAESGQSAVIDLPKKVRVGDRVFKNFDFKLMKKAKESYAQLRELSKAPVYMELIVKVGQPVVAICKDAEGNQVKAETEFIVERAEKRPTTEATIKEKMERLGNTSFELADISIDLQDEAMVPVSVLNELRRHLIESLEGERTSKYQNRYINPNPALTIVNQRLEDRVNLDNPNKGNVDLKLSISVGDLSSLKAAVNSGADVVYFGGENYRSGKKFSRQDLIEGIRCCNNKGVTAVLALPRIVHEEEIEQVRGSLELILKEATPDGLLVGNMGGLELARELTADIPLYGDYHLNAFNIISLEYLKENKVRQVSLSPELNFKQLKLLGKVRGIKRECLVHGSLLMMTSEYCPVGSTIGGRTDRDKCSVPCVKEEYGLQDRLKFVFPVEIDERCRSYIYNPKQLCMIEHISDFYHLGIDTLRVEAKRESGRTVEKIVRAYKGEIAKISENPKRYDDSKVVKIKESLETLTDAGFTKGHYFRGVLDN